MKVTTPSGRLRGLEKDGVVQLRGVRYATAERFRPPDAVEGWDGELDATDWGALAPQNPSPLESLLGADLAEQSEDCLFLNVFTPAVDDGARPVMVWIHGGGFTAGAGSIPWYGGARLAQRGNVVVVTINYRLGALGFAHLPSLGNEFAGSANNGLRDQIEALRWIARNIASLGGDPGRVTLFGESAGGMSIATLLGTPSAAGLFTTAIPQSGSAEVLMSTDEASNVTARMLVALGLGEGDAEAFLELPTRRLLEAQQKIGATLEGEAKGWLPFAPVVDGVVIPRHPLDAVRAGDASAVRLLTGTTANEWNLFHLADRARGPLDDERLHRRVAWAAGADIANEAIAVYQAMLPGATNDDVWCALATDYVFRIPAIRLAEAQSAHQADTYAYVFDFKATAFEGALGACHAIDIPFCFDNVHRRSAAAFLGGVDDRVRLLAERTSGAWLAMARDGSPQYAGLPEWPSYTPGCRAVMELSLTPRVLDDPGSEARELWLAAKA